MLIEISEDATRESYDLRRVKLHCVHNDGWQEVLLCLRKEESNIAFAKIQLPCSEIGDAGASYRDAKKLGDEMVRRWNANVDARASITREQLMAACRAYHGAFDNLRLSEQREIESEASRWWAALSGAVTPLRDE